MTNHRYLDGIISHKRYEPKTHQFKYKFFMVDLDLNDFDSISKNSFFSYNRFNLFSFYSKDHFGENKDFLKNVDYLLETYKIDKTSKMRFITLPRIAGFVFNPISVLLLIEDNKPKYLLAEVHNYNGGRIVYPIELKTVDNRVFSGSTKKDMYVSPFFKRDGDYQFDIIYFDDSFQFVIKLFEDNKKVLISNLIATSKEFSKKNSLSLFFKHTFLTLWVVTRTLYQSLKLKLKGLKWNNPIPQDQTRRI